MLHNNLLQEFLSLSKGVGQYLADPIIALFEDEEPIPPNATLAALTECAYTGYARSTAVTWATAHLNDDGSVVMQAIPKEFKPSGSAASSTARQVVLLDAGGTDILASYVLPEPIVFENEQDTHLIGFPLTLPQDDGTLEEVLP